MREWEFDDPDMPGEIAERLPPEKKALRNALQYKTVADVEEAITYAEEDLKDFREEAEQNVRRAELEVLALRLRLAELRRKGGR